MKKENKKRSTPAMHESQNKDMSYSATTKDSIITAVAGEKSMMVLIQKSGGIKTYKLFRN